MRIAFIVEEFPALSETFILNQITGLIERGHEVDIYAENPRGEAETHPEVEKYNLLDRTCYRSPGNRFSRLLEGSRSLLTHSHKDLVVLLRSLNVFKYGGQAASLRLLDTVLPFLRKRPYEIIHCHFGTNGLIGALLRDIGVVQGKLITTFHGFDITMYPQRFGYGIYEPLFATGDLFLPVSERWKNRLVEMGCDEGKIIVHRMGIDCKRFSFHPRRPRANEGIKIVTIARLVEKKGVEYGIRAVSKLAQGERHIEYYIVGDGPLREKLQRLVEEADIADIVKLLGWKSQQEIYKILNNADILLAPSVTAEDGDQEGIPVSIMEAMATGLPVVSTQHSGIPELVEDGVSGFLVGERDVDALAERLNYLIEHRQLWPEMGRSGRAHIEGHYNIANLNDTLVEIYKRLIA